MIVGEVRALGALAELGVAGPDADTIAEPLSDAVGQLLFYVANLKPMLQMENVHVMRLALSYRLPKKFLQSNLLNWVKRVCSEGRVAK